MTLAIAVAGASILTLIRWRRKIAQSPSIWFGDALNFGTLAILIGLILEAWLVHSPWLEAQVRTNGFLIVLSFIYCAIVICIALWKSIQNARTGESV